jgi:hypothetical protein
MRYVGNVLDNEEHFYDHDNQIVSLTASNDEKIVAFGDIEGMITVYFRQHHLHVN